MTANPAPASGTPGILAAIIRPLAIGLAAISLFILVFLVWGNTAPLAGGAVAAGRISPEGSRRTIQHLEGGIIDELMVRDGDVVESGAPLVALRQTQARASFEVLRNQQRQLLAQRARLRSEQSGRDAVAFPGALVRQAADDPTVRELLDTQRELFLRRSELHTNRQSIFRQRGSQLEAEIAGLREQIVRQRERLDLIALEIEDTQHLFERGLAPRPRLLALQREQASINEQVAANRAAIARAGQSIGETQVQRLAADAQRLDEISTELNDVQARLSEVNERILASEDILDRTVIRAPTAGTIVNLRIQTQGGVIRPGEPILDIVPLDEALIIEARLSPLDVDLVSPGQTAAVHLSALPQRALPRVEGELISVSADTLTDEVTGESYYQVRVRVDAGQLDALGDRVGEDLTLTAGMPAEVLIITGERTMMAYLLAPLTDSLRRALRES